MAVHVFGIRHHGPGSARSVLSAFEQLRPDAVLVEGPVEANDQIPWIANPALKPPVALLIYRPDLPLASVFYPFATFSPEWNALQWAVDHGVVARFIDLPKSNWLALESQDDEPAPAPDDDDPLRTLARLAGEDDFERWWDRLVESRGGDQVFPAIHEAMAALRTDGARPLTRLDALREASMRQEIRAAQKQGFDRIAVVCGAWHAPALITMGPAKDDAALLKGLPKAKVQATWVPWTHGRLLRASGYGAGIESPGWYEHLWNNPDGTVVRWIAKVANLLRAEDLDASPAQTIDTVRLAETLASFRGRPNVTLSELNDATATVMLFGNLAPLQLIGEKLIVGEIMGEVPDDATTAPIQKDLEAEQKRLRLKPETTPRNLDLDLRKDGDRDRSRLLHRLMLISVPWGRLEEARGKLGTFHELWHLRWEPEFAVEVVAAAQWGNTVASAAAERARQIAAAATQLPEVTALIDPVLKADLPDAATPVLDRLRAIAAVAPDVAHLMFAIPPLARVSRYGDVRQTDRTVVDQAINELTARMCAGLPVACGSLSDEAAQPMVVQIGGVHEALTLLERDELRRAWLDTVRRIADLPNLHGLVAGRCCRLLLDASAMETTEVAERASQSLSPGMDPAQGARWIEGFLASSGSVLLVNNTLWDLVDNWVQEIPADAFPNVLPLVRRTFSTFPTGERRQLGLRVRVDGGPRAAATGPIEIDHECAARALPLLAKILGLEMEKPDAD
jgi:hypothetical protein